MPSRERRGAAGLIASLLGLFPGGALVGLGLAALLAPGSRVAEVVSFLALPVAFAVGLQAWYGLALLGLVAQLFRGSRRRAVIGGPPGRGGTPGLFGSWIFLPLSSAAGAAAGVVAGLASPTQPAWLVVLAYWLVGSLHGLIAWRLARRGQLQPPDTL